MAGPLLDTKFHVPRGRRRVVARPRLTERLNRSAEAALTLVSAPAGFGKTTLVAEWLATQAAAGRSVAWLSLDQRDNDPALFWTYLVTALSVAVPGVGTDALALLQSPEPPLEAVLATVINDLSALSLDVVLVLDDFHLIDARSVQDGVAFLLEHLPAQLHLVIAGRADPALPLSRLRGRGELAEIRAADLRFAPEEAAAYLHDVMGLTLTAQDVAALDERTEGWIAALQLAALSMQGRDDVGAFIAGFAGDDRFIVDYLAEEVLNRQPAEVRDFLLQTSILERLSGPLCDAVTGRDDGRATLAALERGNLFLIPLDDRRRWYRYHQLFADVLQAHLRDQRPDGVAELHRRASAWFAESGEPSEAVRHALAADDFGRAADLAEPAIPAMARTRQEATVLGWLAMLPEDVVRVRPVLTVGFAGALLLGGRLDGVEARLAAAERWLAEAGGVAPGSDDWPAGVIVVDQAQFRGLPGMIELYRAALALAAGDVPGTIGHARRAIDRSADHDDLCRASAAGLMGLAYWASGDLEAGYRAYADCLAGLDKVGHLADTLGCAVALGDIRLTQGRPDEALRIYQDALRHAADQGGSGIRGTADMHVGMSEILCERNELPAATAHLLRGEELGEHTGLPQNPYRWRVAMARIRQAQGDLGGALGLLDEAEQLYVGDFFPNVRPVPALRARLWAAQGEVAPALGWAREHGLSADDDLSYLREFEHITLARVLLARDAAQRSEASLLEAAGLLDRLLLAAQAGERIGSVIEILVLQAVAHQAREDRAAALAVLRHAVTLAEPAGYVRIFADEGPPVTALLTVLANEEFASGYLRRLLTAPADTAADMTAADMAFDHAAVDRAAAPATIRGRKPGLIEPLSPRELDVLRLLGSDLDGPDIARELVVSLNTVRTHTKNIYAKLGVNNRRSAVRLATELDLMPRAGDR